MLGRAADVDPREAPKLDYEQAQRAQASYEVVPPDLGQPDPPTEVELIASVESWDAIR